MQSINVQEPYQSISRTMPYCMHVCHVNIFMAPSQHFGQSLIQHFTGSTVDTNNKDFNIFGCNIYALDGKLPVRQIIANRNPCARLGINIGFSSQHACMLYYVLSLQTYTIFPQFHVKHNDFFE